MVRLNRLAVAAAVLFSAAAADALVETHVQEQGESLG
jgi:hypothetical protein